jgi:hypothetical protein
VPIKPVARDSHTARLSDLTRLYVVRTYMEADVALVERALQVTWLPESWKAHPRDRVRNVAT